MPAGDYRIGLEGVFKYGVAGSQADTTTDNVDGVGLNMSKRMAERVRRGKTFVSKKPTATDASVEFEVGDIDSDPFIAAIRAAFFANTRIALYPSDASSGEGLDADYYVSGFKRTEGNVDIITYAVVADPTDELRDPVWQ